MKEPNKFDSKYWCSSGHITEFGEGSIFLEQEFNRDMEAWNNRKEYVKELEDKLEACKKLVQKWHGYTMPKFSECEQWMTKVAYDCADQLEEVLK